MEWQTREQIVCQTSLGNNDDVMLRAVYIYIYIIMYSTGSDAASLDT